MLHGLSVCLFWVEKGACFVSIRRRGGQAGRREPALAGPEHQLSAWPRPIPFPRPRGPLLPPQTLTTSLNRGNTLPRFTCFQRGSIASSFLGVLACVNV